MRDANLAGLNEVGIILVVSALLAGFPAMGQRADEPRAAVQSANLPLDQVVKNLEEKNALRSAALQQFEGKRIYRMQYRGFPGSRDAEMIVSFKFRAPSSKEFKVISESGSKLIIDRVFKRLLEGEQEAANADNRRQTALTRENYNFELSGYENSSEGARYVLNLLPKTKNKFLYRGKVWIDAKDFAVVRIEGEPAKNPSFWIKKTDIAHRYVKVDNFWLPAENHTESIIRLGGKATLSIEYQDYKIIQANPIQASQNPQPGR